MAFRRWFPRSLQEQAGFFANFTRVFTVNAEFLGFTAADVEKLANDNAVLQYLARTDVQIKNFKKSFLLLRDNLCVGSGGEPTYPQFAAPDVPPIVPFGIFNRLFYLSDRITAAENYSPVIGAHLGILPPSRAETSRSETESKPQIKARALAGAQVEVIFIRGKSNGIQLYVKRSGSEEWFDAGRFFQSPAIAEISLREDGKPEEIQLRGRRLKGNNAVGDFSDAALLILKP